MRAVLSLALLLVVLTGCAASPPDSPAVALTAADAGREVTLAPGQRLSVSLASNPTTGYSWALADSAAAVLTRDGERVYTQDPARAGMAGAGGTEVWTFTATRAGRGTLRLAYSRPFEAGQPPAETFEVPVVVR